MADSTNRSLSTGAVLSGTGIALAFGSALYLLSFFALLPLQTIPGGFKVAGGFEVLTGFLLVTLGLERLLEPFTRFFGTDTAKDNLTAAAVTQKTAGEAPPPKASEAVAKAQGAVDRARQWTALVVWGVASGLGFVFASGTNVLLLRSVAADGSTVPPLWLDLLITGVVIGAGTKPVHDLVSRIEKSKSKAEDDAAQKSADPA